MHSVAKSSDWESRPPIPQLLLPAYSLLYSSPPSPSSLPSCSSPPSPISLPRPLFLCCFLFFPDLNLFLGNFLNGRIILAIVDNFSLSTPFVKSPFLLPVICFSRSENSETYSHWSFTLSSSPQNKSIFSHYANVWFVKGEVLPYLTFRGLLIVFHYIAIPLLYTCNYFLRKSRDM